MSAFFCHHTDQILNSNLLRERICRLRKLSGQVFYSLMESVCRPAFEKGHNDSDTGKKKKHGTDCRQQDPEFDLSYIHAFLLICSLLQKHSSILHPASQALSPQPVIYLVQPPLFHDI